MSWHEQLLISTTKSRAALRPAIRAFDLASSALLIALIAVTVAAVVAPFVLGWRYGILRSGSMSPAMPAGAAIVVAPARIEDVSVGDVVTFHSVTNPNLLVTHRVEAITSNRLGRLSLVTRGDGNKDPDGAIVTGDRLMGKVIFSLPKIGLFAQKTHTKLFFGIFVAFPTALIIAIELRELAGGLNDLRQRGKPRLQT
jgi:signal peptidase